MKEWFYALSSREQKLVIATIAVAAICGLYMGGVLLFSSETEVSDAAATRFHDVLDQVASVDQQKARNLNLKKRISNEDSIFTEEDGTLEIFAELEKIAGQSGVELKGTSQSTNTKAKPFPSIDVRVNFECQFNQLVQFLSNIKKAKIVLQPSSMKMQLKDPNQPKLEVQLTVTTYLLNDLPQTGVRS